MVCCLMSTFLFNRLDLIYSTPLGISESCEVGNIVCFLTDGWCLQVMHCIRFQLKVR